MRARATSQAGWPNPLQQKLLRSCFLVGSESAREFAAWRKEADPGQLDDASVRLLPLLARRWSGDPLDIGVAELGSRMRLTHWQMNRARRATAVSLAETLAQARVPCMLLKGMALILRHYADTGLRAMGDIDFLVPLEDVGRATAALIQDGWIAEDNLTPHEIVQQTRVRHAWQFSRGDEENCDLHWHPLVRCYSPAVARHFWDSAEAVEIAGQQVLVPCATDQLFHVCAHGLQWNWVPQIRWIADAMAILASAPHIDWNRLVELAVEANMTVRLQSALEYLRERVEAPVPRSVVDALAAQPVAPWEQREHALLQKAHPLGKLDSARWHFSHFRRIRPYDAGWSNRRFPIAIAEYLALFLKVKGPLALVRALFKQLTGRKKIGGDDGARTRDLRRDRPAL